jgi:pilus assembly protein FimV
MSDFGPPRELSVEELIDLEQQADFFVVLGQDDAAIDLLVGHVRSTGGSSPLPYLKLLEIYSRRADRDAYERTRERFNRRFNAYAPEWGANLQAGKGLDAYPEVVGRLQQLWRSPHRVMEAMDTLLFRRDAAAPMFELPAYREVLFLYAIARDLVQTGNAQPMPPPPPSRVDLALPVAPGRGFAEETLPLLTNVPEGYRPTEVPPVRGLDIDLTDATPAATDFRGLIDPAGKPDAG